MLSSIKNKLIFTIRFLKIAGSGIIAFSSSACEKEELPVAAYDRGDIQTTAIELGADYKMQVFYKLDGNKIVSQNIKSNWDLAFETGISGFHLRLNYAKAMQVVNTNETNFSSVSSKPTTGWKWDVASSNPDSLAFGEWTDWNGTTGVSKKEVYVLDLGYNAAGTHQGFKKIQVLSVSDKTYTFKFANLNGTEVKDYTITKDNDYNSVFFSFADGGKEVLVEPKTTEWDLVFTQYTHTFYDDPEPSIYLVTGVLQNRVTVLAKKDTVIGFQNFTYENAVKIPLDSAANAIGYKWKEYNYDNSSYAIFSNQNFVIQDQSGFYYKLHFIDFYNKSGEKGTPTFEFQKL